MRSPLQRRRLAAGRPKTRTFVGDDSGKSSAPTADPVPDCPHCYGKGKEIFLLRPGDKDCPACKGTGKIAPVESPPAAPEKYCEDCGNTGELPSMYGNVPCESCRDTVRP